MSRAEDLFDDAARERIREAVAAAERRTGGEIVPCVVSACDVYEGARYKAATLGSLVAVLLAGAADATLELWGIPSWLFIVLPAPAGAALGWLLAFAWPGLRRALAGDEALETRARRRAAVAFLDEEVFATRDRTGILVFVALFEHRVVILGDSGINARVEPTEWQSIADGVVAGIRAGRAADALTEAIGRCGELLTERRVPRRADDADELDDRLRIHED